MDEQERQNAENAEIKERTRPLTQKDFVNGTTQLEIDAVNAMEKRIDISTFSEGYQRKIRNYYRFTPVNVGSPNGGISGGRSAWK